MLDVVDPLGSIFCSCKTLVATVPFFSVHTTFPPFGFWSVCSWAFSATRVAFWCGVHKIPEKFHAQNHWEIPAMRPNRPAEEGDGAGWGLASVTVIFLIPKQFPIGIGNFWGSVSVTVTLLIPKQFPIGIGIGNFLEINSKTISYR